MQQIEKTPIRFLKGVGEKRGALYTKLGIETVGDLLCYYPRAYIDFSCPQPISSAPYHKPCAILATVISKAGEQRIRRDMSLFKVRVTDDEVDMSITFFNAKYTVEALEIGEKYFFYGKVAGTLTRREMQSPMVLSYDKTMAMQPVYPLTAGLGNRMLISNMRQALAYACAGIVDALPEQIRAQYKLCDSMCALKNIHLPQSAEALADARRRLIFEELLILSLSMARVRAGVQKSAGARMKNTSLEPFYSTLPFEPTNAQCRAIADCTADFCSGAPMNRLVQGDVGCGKTLVSAACAWFAHKNGLQSAMMAPTEILAEQHERTLSALLAPFGIRVGLLTGSLKAAQKRMIRQRLIAGEIDLIVGTHALIQDGVEFASLGLVMTDEQHRFGVAQRARLASKGHNPHVLVMSATPIPRTLAFIIYGDLDVSVIDELPKGRQPIHTYVVPPTLHHRAYGFIRKHLDAGEQAYIVCPLVEQGEGDVGLEAAVEYAEKVQGEAFALYRVGVLHGRMKPAEKEKTMRAFAAGELQLLVATTVIEVGVDVPNATIMLVENAERFGLSQLHQLRGRIGRGSGESFCILVSASDAERLSVIERTSDGFRISEEDLKLRGPGDYFGSRQHGLPQLKIADMLTDMELLHLAQQAAMNLLEVDATLNLPEHLALREAVDKMTAGANL